MKLGRQPPVSGHCVCCELLFLDGPRPVFQNVVHLEEEQFDARDFSAYLLKLFAFGGLLPVVRHAGTCFRRRELLIPHCVV